MYGCSHFTFGQRQGRKADKSKASVQVVPFDRYVEIDQKADLIPADSAKLADRLAAYQHSFYFRRSACASFVQMA